MDALAGSPLYLETESLRTVLSSVADQLACITDTVRRKGEGEGEGEEEEIGGEEWAGGGIGGEGRGGEGRGEKKRGRKDIILFCCEHLLPLSCSCRSLFKSTLVCFGLSSLLAKNVPQRYPPITTPIMHAHAQTGSHAHDTI